MVAAQQQARTPFGEPIRKPPQQQQKSTGVGTRKVGTGFGQQQKPTGIASVTRKPLAQQSKKSATTSEGKKKFWNLGCCKAKKKTGVQKAAPSKESNKKSLSSFFSRNKKSTDFSLKKRPAPVRPTQSLQSNRLPTAAGIIAPKKQPPNSKASSVASTKSNSKSKEKSDKKVVKSAPTKIELKKEQKSQKSSVDSPKKSEKELKTGREDSFKEVKKPKVKSVTKSVKGRDTAFATRKNFQEVKICVSNYGNGMTERKVMLTSVYPTNQAQKPYISSAAYPPWKKTYTTLKRANSTERLPVLG